MAAVLRSGDLRALSKTAYDFTGLLMQFVLESTPSVQRYRENQAPISAVLLATCVNSVADKGDWTGEIL